ncbi:MAG: hypothetical protein U0263_16765 [Polyangiaceae bacterium]
MHTKSAFLALAALALIAGCGASRDVEVTGQVDAPATAKGDIVVEFFDGMDATESAHSLKLAGPSAFVEKVPLEGDTLRVRAVLDADGDGKCSAGELWDEVAKKVDDDDKVDDLVLTLESGACP